jgi:hypothetical protein
VCRAGAVHFRSFRLRCQPSRDRHVCAVFSSCFCSVIAASQNFFEHGTFHI